MAKILKVCKSIRSFKGLAAKTGLKKLLTESPILNMEEIRTSVQYNQRCVSIPLILIRTGELKLTQHHIKRTVMELEFLIAMLFSTTIEIPNLY